jgi:hypothetical protein
VANFVICYTAWPRALDDFFSAPKEMRKHIYNNKYKLLNSQPTQTAAKAPGRLLHSFIFTPKKQLFLRSHTQTHTHTRPAEVCHRKTIKSCRREFIHKARSKLKSDTAGRRAAKNALSPERERERHEHIYNNELISIVRSSLRE